MNSFPQLHHKWSTLRATFAKEIKDSETGHIISSEVQYATAAWHNKLKVWRDELDQLITEYASEADEAQPSQTGIVLPSRVNNDIHVV